MLYAMWAGTDILLEWTWLTTLRINFVHEMFYKTFLGGQNPGTGSYCFKIPFYLNVIVHPFGHVFQHPGCQGQVAAE